MPVRRLPAEWEPQSAIQLTFPHKDTDWYNLLPEVTSCYRNVILAITRFEPVVLVCQSKEEVKSVLGDAILEHVSLVELPTNDTWARDHGGITILEDEKPVVLDFMFNGWGLKFPANHDNCITSGMQLAGVFGHHPVLKPGLVLEGGGIESDGNGTLMTTTECLLSPNRNPHLSKDQLEEHLKLLLGVHRVLWLDYGYLAGDDTDSHIDTLARFCDPETIAYVQCLDKNDEHYEALWNMEQQLTAFRNDKGQPYNLVPLPMCSPCYSSEGHRLPATYANFLIINNAVLVPTYQLPEDEQALVILQTCFPTREIIGIDCRVLIEQHGSLHCISMQYPALCIDNFINFTQQ